MKRSQKFVACLVIAVGLLVIAVPCLMLWVFREVIAQTNGPTTREQAVAMGCPIELPASASNVQFASLAGGLQDCEQYVRFEGPLAELYQTAKRCFAKAETDGGTTFIPVSHPGAQLSSRLKTQWFDITNISKGSICRQSETYGKPTIWVDEERSIFYFHFID